MKWASAESTFHFLCISVSSSSLAFCLSASETSHNMQQDKLGDRNTKTPRSSTTPKDMSRRTPPSAGQPWKMTPLTSNKSDMKDIMAQAASSRTSILSQGLASGPSSINDLPTPLALPGPKMSQKERKRLQQNQPTPVASPDLDRRSESSPSPKVSAWQTQSASKVPTIKEVLASQSPTNAPKPTGSRTTSTPHLTMRQTVANTKPSTEAKRPTTGPSATWEPLALNSCAIRLPRSRTRSLSHDAAAERPAGKTLA